MKKGSIFILALLVVLTLIQCTKEPVGTSIRKAPNLPAQYFDYEASIADLGNVTDNTPFNNQLTNPGATLGRVLFYDPALSINNTVSCATCHKQELAFSDNKALSVGFEDVLTKRNSPPIMNMRASNQFFWDFSESSLENQVIAPIGNHIEMGMEDMDYLVNKLQNIDYYPALFKDAFGSDQINKTNISKALAQFIRSINSFDSRFDIERKNNFQGFTGLEKLGSEVFLNSGCNNCHNVMGNFFFEGEFDGTTIIDMPFFGGEYGGTGSDLANIGLDAVDRDLGAGNGMFKVPSLRNIIFTAPYMHDGRFATLDDVIDHYSHGIKNNEFLDSRLQNFEGQPQRLDLTPLERNALKEFLFTLTDTKFMQDEKFSNPFKN